MKKSIAVLFIFGILFATLGNVYAVTYSFEALHYPGAIKTYVTDINDSGSIVGYYERIPDNEWDRRYTLGFILKGSTWTTLDLSDTQQSTYPQGINNKDWVVGYKDHSDIYGFTWGFGNPWLYSCPGYDGHFSGFYDVNDSGLIIGSCGSLLGCAGFSFDGTSYNMFQLPDGSCGTPVGINNQGKIISRSETISYYFDGIVWKEVWYPNSQSTAAYAINNQNWIVGSYTNVYGKSRGFSHNGLTYYGSGNYPGAVETWSVDTNDQNMIVGHYMDSYGKIHGYSLMNSVWSSIDYPGSSETKALFVNNLGFIVGSYVKNGEEGYFLAKPTAKPTVTIVATDPTATEAGPTTGTITIYRTGSTASALTVYYTGGGTATAGIDRAYLPGNITIPAGASSGAITITPINDSAVESSETVILTLKANTAYTIGSPASATVTITDNDGTITKPVVTISSTDSTATEAGPTTGRITVYRTGSTTSPLTVYYTGGGTAMAGTDRSYLPGSITIPSGVSSASITITPINDSIRESSETVVLTLKANTAYTIGTPSSATVIITDND
ncbi:MAG: Calx-beta domain-containing protein [Syntrophorhabdaceae bacterium]